MDGDATLVCTGDLAPSRALGEGRQEVWDRLRSADLAVVNLELPLTTSSAPAEKAVNLRADPELAPSLAQAGIGAATVANNHALDYGAEGLLETLAALEGAGVAAVGGGSDLEEALRPALFDLRGTSVAVFGLACALPPGFAAGKGRPGIAPVRIRSRFYLDNTALDEQPGMSPWVETEAVDEDVRLVCERIAEAKDEADLVMVQIHWGVPNGWCAAFQGPLADYQRPLAHALVDAGAGLIVGHHPHVVHGVEVYREGMIAYSLGNFLFHSMAGDGIALANNYPPYDLSSLETGEAREAVLLEARVGEGGRREIRFRPVRMDGEGDPEPLAGGEGSAVLARLADLSSRLETLVEVRDGEAMVAP
jgi:poly-gamma-glutamate capsule biosynthesis protein CapA/YwtB (metallophosphatase superfamily)